MLDDLHLGPRPDERPGFRGSGMVIGTVHPMNTIPRTLASQGPLAELVPTTFDGLPALVLVGRDLAISAGRLQPFRVMSGPFRIVKLLV